MDIPQPDTRDASNSLLSILVYGLITRVYPYPTKLTSLLYIPIQLYARTPPLLIPGSADTSPPQPRHEPVRQPASRGLQQLGRAAAVPTQLRHQPTPRRLPPPGPLPVVVLVAQ